MPVVTSTEASVTDVFVSYSHATLNNLGSCTIVAYAKPTGSGEGGFGYLFGKTPSGSVAGPRLYIDHNGAGPRLAFGSSSAGAGLPTASTTSGTVTYSAWAYFTCTFDGTLNGSGINLYINGVDQRDAGSLTNGTSALSDDSANAVYLMNRQGLARDFVGDVAWIAVWDRVLNSTERAQVVNGAGGEGPFSVPSGLVLCFANDTDYAQGLSQASRSARSTGSAPTNTTLGSTTTTIAVPAGALTLTGNSPTVAVSASGTTISVPAGSLTLTGRVPTVIATANQSISVPLATMTLTGLAPTVTAANHQSISVPAGVLTFTGYAPTVTGGEIWADVSDSSGSWSPIGASSGSWSAISPSSGTWTAQ